MGMIPTEELVLHEIRQLLDETRKSNDLLKAIYEHLIDHVGGNGNPLA